MQAFINKDLLKLSQLKEKSHELGLIQGEKINRLKTWKNFVFCSVFDQMYAVRIANLVSLITLTQTGKRYFKNKIAIQNLETDENGNEQD